MREILGDASGLGWVATKAALLFLTAVVALRIARRRTVAQMSTIDFVAAVAVGAIIGRVPNSSTTSFVQGAATLLTILAVHGVLTYARRLRGVARLVDHPPTLIVAHGRIDDAALRRCTLTRDDVYEALRGRGVLDLSEVQYLVYEPRGRFSLVERDREVEGSVVLASALGTSATGGPS